MTADSQSDFSNQHSRLLAALVGIAFKAAPAMLGELHHYTTADGLLGILSTCELWATHALFLNDAEEIEVGLAIYKDTVEGAMKAVGAKHSARVQDVFNTAPLHVEMLRQSAAFVICLSAAENQLSQWRAYSGTATGYSIAFNAEHLSDFGSFDFNQFALRQVLYDMKEQAKLATDTLAHFAAYIDLLSEETWKQDKARLNELFVTWLHLLLMGMKRDVFSEERESRLIAIDWDAQVPTYSFRTSRSGLVVPYRVFRPPSPHRLPITRIIVGPTNHPVIAVRSVQQLLRKHGYDEVQVQFCDIPLREL